MLTRNNGRIRRVRVNLEVRPEDFDA